jgi:hypothetical protein
MRSLRCHIARPRYCVSMVLVHVSAKLPTNGVDEEVWQLPKPKEYAPNYHDHVVRGARHQP